MIERDIDCRKHRKSTHIASADLDTISLEGKPLIFEIEDVRYETQVNVSGKKTDGYFVKLVGQKKEWMVNSTNRTTISGFAKTAGHKDGAQYNIGNWKGLLIELFVDRNVSLMGKTVDGIRVAKIQPKRPDVKKVKPEFSAKNFEAALKAKATIEVIKKSYTISPETEAKYIDYVGK